MMFNNHNVLRMTLGVRWAGMLVETTDVPPWYNGHNELVFRYENELMFYTKTQYVGYCLNITLLNVADVL